MPVLLHGDRRLRHGQGRRRWLVARPAGRHHRLRRHRGADRPSHHPAPRPVPGPGHLRLRRRGGQRVLPRHPHLRLRWAQCRPDRAAGAVVRRRRRRVPAGHRVLRPGRLDGPGHPPEPVRSAAPWPSTTRRRPTPLWASTSAFTKVAVFAIAAGMAGLAGALYGTVQQVVGTSDFDFFSGIIFVLFVTIWSIRTVSGAFLAAADLCRAQPAVAQRLGPLCRRGHHPDRPGRRRHPGYRGPPVPIFPG